MKRARPSSAKRRTASASTEYNVGYHYYRSRWCPGAVDRFKALLEKDPQFTRRDSVYFYLGECYAKANQPAEALPYFDRLDPGVRNRASTWPRRRNEWRC